MLAVHLGLNSLYLCPLVLVVVLGAKESQKTNTYSTKDNLVTV